MAFRCWRNPELSFVMVLVGCLGQPQNQKHPPSGVATTFDSAGDTIRAVAAGDVHDTMVRRLAEEVRIAPTPEDTLLYDALGEVRVDQRGWIWVFDPRQMAILLFDDSGKLVRRVGRSGGGPGEFKNVNGMTVLPDTGIAVLDDQSARISTFDRLGEFKASTVVGRRFSTNNGLLADREGNLYLLDRVAPPTDGEVHGRIGLTTLTVAGSIGDSLVPPQLPVEVHNYVVEMAWGKGSYGQPYGPAYIWAYHHDGYFVVADGGRYRIVIARRQGKPIEIQRTSAPVTIPQDERAELQSLMEHRLGQMAQKKVTLDPPIPSSKAPLEGLKVTRDGRLWAIVPLLSERIPNDQIDSSGSPAGTPVPHFRSRTAYEVFSATGEFLGRIGPTPGLLSIVEADGNRVWAIVSQSSGLSAIVRYRIEPGLLSSLRH